jgi:RNA recognition motif-containing protein
VSRGFAFITFWEHEHAKKAIDTFNGTTFEHAKISVMWASDANSLESAQEKSAEYAKACMEKDVQWAQANKLAKLHKLAGCAETSHEVANMSHEVSLDFRFEGRIKARSDGGRAGKQTRGFIVVSPNQLQILQRHPLWKPGFKSDVFWHRKDCNDETRYPGDTVTFTVIVGSQGDGMQAQHVQLKQ